jgi:hypothetical protein
MKTKHLLLLVGLLILLSCKKDDETDTVGGTQSAIGAVNNSFAVSAIPGVQTFNAKVTALENGISTITWTAGVTDPSVLAVISALSGSANEGASFTRTSKYKITSEGIESVYPEGNLILVKYGAKVGDTWSRTIKSSSISRTVTNVSTADDYSWNNMQIKTINVSETGRGLPGVSKIEFIFNHKFGIVGLMVYLEDGTARKISIFSKNTNS